MEFKKIDLEAETWKFLYLELVSFVILIMMLAYDRINSISKG